MYNFLPEYVLLSLCHEFTIKPGDITREGVIDQDHRCAVFNRCINKELPGLSRRDRSLVMLIAFMSEFVEPKHSVGEACEVYRDAVSEEIIVPSSGEATESGEPHERWSVPAKVKIWETQPGDVIVRSTPLGRTLCAF